MLLTFCCRVAITDLDKLAFAMLYSYKQYGLYTIYRVIFVEPNFLGS